MSNEAHFRKLEQIFNSAPCNEYYAPLIQVQDGYAEVTIPIRPDFLQGGGVVHGSVLFRALDDAATFAANSLSEDVALLTSAFTVYFVRPVSAGMIKATGQVVHQSRRLLVAEAVAIDFDGRQVARGSGTFMRSNIPLPSVE